MNRAEFDGWLAGHMARFSAIKPKLTPDVIEEWWYVLKAVDYDNALEISRSMFAGEEEAPVRVDAHPRSVKALANRKTYGPSNTNVGDPDRPRPTRKGGQDVYDCRQCQDVGEVTVWSPRAMHAMKFGKFERPSHLRSCAVSCDCQWAKTKNNRRKTPFLVYDPTKMVLIGTSVGDPAEEENLEFWIDNPPAQAEAEAAAPF